MRLLAPLGLIALISIAVLILIYVLKPNYQQKIVSSTYVWKLSLKYKKRRIATGKLRNVLIILCQILILICCALLLTRPVWSTVQRSYANEKVAIIDASGSMYTQLNGETRFERAVSGVKELAASTAAQNGYTTVILAGEKAEIIAQHTSSTQLNELNSKLDELVNGESGFECGYGAADIDGAIKIAESITDIYPNSEVVYYTGTAYTAVDGVTIVDVAKRGGEGDEAGEWNAAILDCVAEIEDNFYKFTVQAAVYGRDMKGEIDITLNGVNGTTDTLTLVKREITFENDRAVEVVFGEDSASDSASDVSVYSFESAYVRIDVNDDSFENDNIFYLYGGTKQTLNIEYCSTSENPFFRGTLMGLRDILRSRWNIGLNLNEYNGNPVISGFDFYIFEQVVPQELPKDGLVFLINPQSIPEGIDITLDEEYVEGEFHLAPGITHPVTQYINPANIYVTRYTRATAGSDFQPLMYCGGDPVLLIKEEPECKLAVLTFGLGYSDLSMLVEFNMLLYNLIQHFLPSTITDYVFDVGEEVSLNARGETLSVSGDGVSEEYSSFPQTLVLHKPGTFTLTQTLPSGEEITENFFVKLPSEQSNIFRTEALLRGPSRQDEDLSDMNLTIFIAAALVALLFIEWFLQSRNQF